MQAVTLSIIAHARSGALDHAWRLFREAGLETVNDDPAVLSVRGRLLKDSARATEGEEARRQFYQRAAEAYARAGEIGGATYPLINAATLSLLAGHREQAEFLARQVLERNLRGEPETPYYRAATRAEALLLLGDTAQGKADFKEAISLAPQAFEDHASTLRQFGLILDALGEDKAWLDACRPPRSLHFAGHMALAGDGGAIKQRIRTAIEQERIGFGFGALAAGADILAAEALLEAGAELHLILPARRDLFREASVASYGDAWASRFDRIVEAANTVRSIANDTDPLSPLAIRLAAEIAMGRAAMQADMLMTEAVQLLIFDRNAPDERMAGSSQWIGARWKESGRRQRIVAASRGRAAKAVPVPAEPVQDCLAAMLRIDLSDAGDTTTNLLSRLAHALVAAPKPVVPPRWTGEALLVAFDSTATAAKAALSLSAASDLPATMRIAGHFAIVQRADDPFGGAPYLTGPATALPRQIVNSTPAGATHVTEDFAASLHAGPVLARVRTEYVGELPTDEIENPVKLFSLKR